MSEEPKEILGYFCAPSHSLVNACNLPLEIHPRERDFKGLSDTLLEDKAKNGYMCPKFHVDPDVRQYLRTLHRITLIYDI